MLALLLRADLRGAAEWESKCLLDRYLPFDLATDIADDA